MKVKYMATPFFEFYITTWHVSWQLTCQESQSNFNVGFAGGNRLMVNPSIHLMIFSKGVTYSHMRGDRNITISHMTNNIKLLCTEKPASIQRERKRTGAQCKSLNKSQIPITWNFKGRAFFFFPSASLLHGSCKIGWHLYESRLMHMTFVKGKKVLGRK